MGARAAAPTHSSARRPPPPGCLRSEWGRRKAGRGWGKAGPGRARRSALPARSQRGTGTARPRSGDGAGRGGGDGLQPESGRPRSLPAAPASPGRAFSPRGSARPAAVGFCLRAGWPGPFGRLVVTEEKKNLKSKPGH